MYQIMLVEDEMLVRESMAQNTNWDKFGFAPPHVFENGRQALEQLESVLPDVVITDICMPFVDGLELARNIYEKFPDTIVVVLTGFSEFSYAQSAVEYHVLHYLLKPVSVPKLRDVFCEIREKLDAQEASQNAMLNREEHYEKLMVHQRQSFVMEAASGILKDSEVLKERLSLLDVAPNQPERLLLTRVML